MVARGDADAMVTGLTRNYSVALDTVRNVDTKPGHRVIGVSLALCRGAPCWSPIRP
jgi:malate dehydrogenase (oxaloacetate-decarboxylating)(NADP+)